jgi:hypothetical protein
LPSMLRFVPLSTNRGWGMVVLGERQGWAWVGGDSSSR